MGESSTGESVDVVEKEKQFFHSIIVVSSFSNCYYYCTMLQDLFLKWFWFVCVETP